ncbi:hypothetical protein OZX65_06695 [Leuconostocaceae bacterium ESL0723]|nr:hypothetical protein OZX65_06695 [Leuconostocaceae bacterium ESL0723]
MLALSIAALCALAAFVVGDMGLVATPAWLQKHFMLIAVFYVLTTGALLATPERK